jgi:CTP:phosphocholine cytidylyltransferase/choline kinase
MKRRYFQIIELMKKNPAVTQREIAGTLKISLAYVNQILFAMEQDGFLKTNGLPAIGKRVLTIKAHTEYDSCKVDNAIIMAAGFGSRFIPLTYAIPKGLLEVFGERMIERQIKQLQEAGITDITVVVGYLKDTFEYLIDKYNVKLVYNPDFQSKNNLSTLYHVRDRLKNTYILSSDNWLRKNMYHAYEYDSWYSAVKVNEKTKEWVLQLGLHDKIMKVKVGGRNAWVMYGPVYFSRAFSDAIRPMIEEAYHRNDTDDWYWEDVLSRHLNTLTMFANKQPANQVYEFESLEELRQFDTSYMVSTQNKWMELISRVFGQPEMKIKNLRPLRLGMTNKSFIFELNNNKYIFRIPGAGTDILINRKQEYTVYKAIEPLGISDKIIYFDQNTGVKITQFEENKHVADPHNPDDLEACMWIARKLHTSGITVRHRFDFRERINFYEQQAEALHGILFYDYAEVRAKMNTLLDLLDTLKKPEVLTHIDLICDNFIISEGDVKLIDWEYAAMCDPLVDLAMFSIYSYFSEAQINDLMQRYFRRAPENAEKLRVFIYVALAGFLWALWTCYKQALGENFGEYGLKMYRYAKDYYKHVTQMTEPPAQQDEENEGTRNEESEAQ